MVCSRDSVWPGVADGEYLPIVTIGVEPVQILSAVVCVDLHVHRTVRAAAIRNLLLPQSGEDRFKLSVGDRETIVVHIEFVAFHKVDGEGLVDIDSREYAK